MVEKIIAMPANLGWEVKYPNTYGKYGHTVDGDWEWFENGDKLRREITDSEVAEMMSIILDSYLEARSELAKTARTYVEKVSTINDILAEDVSAEEKVDKIKEVSYYNDWMF